MSAGYFGMSILSIGGLISKGQSILYLGRVVLMGAGAMALEYLMTMQFSATELFGSLNIFTGSVIEAGPETMSKVVWVLFGVWVLHVIAFFAIGWKKHLKTLDGDEVAQSLFEDMNVSIIQEGNS